MANYTKINDFTAKDSLVSGNINKRVRGSEFDAEFNAISAAITTKSEFVAGMIMMWSGSIASVPVGWALCDGGGGRPDLRNRFVVGAGSAYAPNAIGGSADAVVVNHFHYTRSYASGAEAAGFGLSPAVGFLDRVQVNTSADPTITRQTASEGVSGTNANLPPYYALAYIIKT